jgi:catechol 2,3-dioxygenase-like lactoylglutathione lyase family enzyme
MAKDTAKNSEKDERPDVWIGHVSLATPDVKAMCDFVVRLGMRRIFEGDGIAVLELRGGTHLLLTASDEPASGLAYFDLMVEDLDASHARLREMGCRPSQIESREFHSSFTVDAPSGHTIKFNSTHVSDLPV